MKRSIINKFTVRITKKKVGKTQITNIRNKRGDIATDPMDSIRIIEEYYKKLYIHKLDNLVSLIANQHRVCSLIAAFNSFAFFS